MAKKKKTEKKSEGKIRAHLKKIKEFNKFLFFGIITFLIILFFFFGTKIYLFSNFVLGSDTIVKLNVDKESLFITNSESQDVKFDVYVSSNVFCSATCEYSFKDLGSGKIIDNGTFEEKIINPSMKYKLIAPERGRGQNLYSFEVSCLAKSQGFCESSEEAKRRSYLLAMNYELSVEQLINKNKSRIFLEELISENDKILNINNENNILIEKLNERIFIDNFNYSNIGIEEVIDSKIELWESYNYDTIIEKEFADIVNETLMNLTTKNNELKNQVNDYNNLILDFNFLRENILNLTSKEDISESDYEKIEFLIKDYNDIIVGIENKFVLNEKINILEKTSSNLFNISDNIHKNKKNSIENNTYNYSNILPYNLSLINFSYDFNNYNKNMIEDEPICCYDGACQSCCSDLCKSDSSKYPILLIHGHSFNNKVSAENSLNDLDSIKKSMINDGLIDGGYITVDKGSESQTFSRTNKQMVFSGSYYFDIFQTSEEDIILQTKGDSLDTYALRVNDIIKNMKLMTGRDKVVIVSHSMGGLVVRRYLQIFGSEDVEKFVMIGTPNHGVDGYVLGGCSVLGANSHCQAMDKDSLFLNKLNFGKVPVVETSTIIGLGCDLNGEPADGVVKNSSAYLEWANNYYVEGKCSGVSFLHTEIIDIEKYPKTYEIIKKIIKL